jgi:putative transposase
MAEETVADETKDAVVAGASPPERKQRAARRPKAASEAIVADQASSSEVVSAERKRRGGKQLQPATVRKNAQKQPQPKPVGATETSVTAVASAHDSAAYGMAELLQLEEENTRLRRTLADKLKAENADLRKKLGLS